MKQAIKKLLLSSTLVFCSLTSNHQNLYASNMQQKAIKATIGQNVTPDTAKALIEDKNKLAEYQKEIKGQGLDMTADEYIAEKTAVAPDTYGTTAADRKLLPYIKAKALYNKLTSNDTTALTGGVTKAQAIAVLNAAITAGIPVNMIKKGGLIGIEAAHKLAGAGGLALPTDEIHLKAMHYLLTSDKTPAVKLLGNAIVIGAPYVNAVIALTTHDTTGSHGANPLPWDKVNSVNVLAVANASHGANAIDPEALKELLWAIRNGWCGRTKGSVPVHLAKIVTDQGTVNNATGNSVVEFAIIWSAPSSPAMKAIVSARMNVNNNIGHFYVPVADFGYQASTLDKGGNLTHDRFVVFTNLVKATDADSVKFIQAASHIHK